MLVNCITGNQIFLALVLLLCVISVHVGTLALTEVEYDATECVQ